MSIKLLIVDDHEAVRFGLKLAFAQTEVEVVCEAETVKSAIKAALEENLDAVLLDIRLADGDGWEVLQLVKQEKSDLPFLIYSLHDNPYWVERSKMQGANGYIGKGAGTESLLKAVRQVAKGETYWVPEDA